MDVCILCLTAALAGLRSHVVGDDLRPGSPKQSGNYEVAKAAALQAGVPTEPSIPVSVERIQRELKKLPPIQPEPERLRIRVTIEGHPLRLSVPWDPANDSAVPNYVRPRMPLYHHEFLTAVTPQEFRGGTLFPISFNVLPAVGRGVQALRDTLRRFEEARIRREVQEELRKFLEAREKQKEEANKKKR